MFAESRLFDPNTIANVYRVYSKEKSHINVVVIGHVDSGKSTTTGHLIYKASLLIPTFFTFSASKSNFKFSAVVSTSVPLRSSRRRLLSSERVPSSTPGFLTN
jgi:hypothetical protein